LKNEDFQRKLQSFSKEASKNFKGRFEETLKKLRRNFKETSKKTWHELQSF
jgi:hypothetical protein